MVSVIKKYISLKTSIIEEKTFIDYLELSFDSIELLVKILQEILIVLVYLNACCKLLCIDTSKKWQFPISIIFLAGEKNKKISIE